MPQTPEAPQDAQPGIELGTERDGRVYLPRRWLDTPPSPIGTVPLAFPDIDGRVDLTLDVVLLIDAAGMVRGVDVRTPFVHEAFVRTVVDAFMQARFTPGEIGGAAVPSEIRIEVEFRA